MRTLKSLEQAKFFENSVTTNEVKRKYKRSKYEPYKLYVPENLDIDTILRDNPPNFVGLPRNYSIYRSKFLYILHLISSIPNSKNDFDFEKYLGFTPVNKVFLRNRIHEYRFYLDYLIENEILIEGTKFIPSEYSRGLKFTKKYRTKVKTVTINCNSLIKSIVSNKNNRDVEKEKQLAFLFDWFNKDLHIDFDAALKFIENDKEKAIKKAIMKREMKKYKASYKLLLPSIDEIVDLGNNSKIFTITQMKDCDYKNKLRIDTNTGRFHTPLTRLKKELRQYVSFKTERLVNIDITNSQPLLSLIILDIDIFMNLNIKDLISKYNPTYSDKVDNSKRIISSSNYTKLVNLIRKNSNKDDVIEYKKAVIEGVYYERFGEILLENDLIPEEILAIADIDERYTAIRKYAKIATFQSFFDTRRAFIYNPIVKAFKTCYPNVYEIFQQVKLGKRLVLKKGVLVKEATYNTLACILQRFESHLVLEKTCSEINSYNAEIPIFTIHDSVITTEKNYEVAKQIFAKNIKELIGVSPILQKEIW